MTALVQLPFEQAHPLEAAPQLRALQARSSIHKIRTATGDPAWLVTGYEDVRRLLADPRLGRSHPDPASAARTGESVLFGGPLGNYQTEEADHARMRSLLQPHFAPGRMRALRPRVAALTTGLLDGLARRDPAGRPHRRARRAAADPGHLRAARRAVRRPGPVPRLDPRRR